MKRHFFEFFTYLTARAGPDHPYSHCPALFPGPLPLVRFLYPLPDPSSRPLFPAPLPGPSSRPLFPTPLPGPSSPAPLPGRSSPKKQYLPPGSRFKLRSMEHSAMDPCLSPEVRYPQDMLSCQRHPSAEPIRSGTRRSGQIRWRSARRFGYFSTISNPSGPNPNPSSLFQIRSPFSSTPA